MLQRKLEIDKEQAAEKAKVTPTVAAGREGYALKSADGDFQVKFRGYIQADGRFVGDNDTTSGPTTFALRRVRPVLEATAFKIFDFKLMPDFGQGQAVLYDAYADARFAPWLKLRIGKYKPQFGLERLQSATELTSHRARHADQHRAESRSRREPLRRPGRASGCPTRLASSTASSTAATPTSTTRAARTCSRASSPCRSGTRRATRSRGSARASPSPAAASTAR